MHTKPPLLSLAFVLGAFAVGTLHAQTSPSTPDIVPVYTAPTDANDYVKRVVEIPMRDGVKLHTVIVVPKGAQDAPILLTRTPYHADGRTLRMASPNMIDLLPQGDEVSVQAGYIRVFQDVRGKYGSQGECIMNRPLVGPLKSARGASVADQARPVRQRGCRVILISVS